MSKKNGSGTGRCSRFSQIVQAVWFAVHKAKPRAIRAQKLRSSVGREVAFAAQTANPANIATKAPRSANSVNPGLFCPIRQTTAKARVYPAAATNQRWRLSGL